MKKLLLLLLCVPLIFTTCKKEEEIIIPPGWNFGGTNYDEGSSVQQTTDGGYIIVGTTEAIGNPEFPITGTPPDIYLIKTDGSGIEQWSQTFGGSGSEIGHYVQQTTDGGYIITGQTDSTESGNGWDVYLIKTDGNGIEQWSQTFGGAGTDNGQSVQQTTDGGYIVAGSWLIKTDGNGNTEWINQDIHGYDVQQTTDGGYIICGTTNSFGDGTWDVYLIKTDGSGIEQWTKTFGGGNDYYYGLSVQQTTDGGFIISGPTLFVDNNGNVYSDVYLIKTDGNGDSLWTKTFGGTDLEQSSSVQQTTDGGYIICGQTGPFGSEDVYLIKTDGSGIEQWSKTFGGSGEDWGYSVQQTTDGGYIITGKTYPDPANQDYPPSYSDVYLIKTDGNGNITSEFTIPVNAK